MHLLTILSSSSHFFYSQLHDIHIDELSPEYDIVDLTKKRKLSPIQSDLAIDIGYL